MPKHPEDGDKTVQTAFAGSTRILIRDEGLFFQASWSSRTGYYLDSHYLYELGGCLWQTRTALEKSVFLTSSGNPIWLYHYVYHLYQHIEYPANALPFGNGVWVNRLQLIKHSRTRLLLQVRQMSFKLTLPVLNAYLGKIYNHISAR